jgi:hypothetical protein
VRLLWLRTVAARSTFKANALAAPLDVQIGLVGMQEVPQRRLNSQTGQIASMGLQEAI